MASTSQVLANKGSRPISAHPAFPAVVALWFAALLGLGTLVLPVALFERLVTATGLAAIIPAAAPPLGFTARAGIALVGIVLGAVLGLYAARQIAPDAPDAPRRRTLLQRELPRRQPLNAQVELGSESFDSVSGFATMRRRALAATEDLRKSDFFQVAPLPASSLTTAMPMPRKMPSPSISGNVPNLPKCKTSTCRMRLSRRKLRWARIRYCPLDRAKLLRVSR